MRDTTSSATTKSEVWFTTGRRSVCPCQGYESLTLAFCLATSRCMNLGPSFLRLRVPKFALSSVLLAGSFPGFGPPREYRLTGNLASLFGS
jgi:hypothetical protein